MTAVPSSSRRPTESEAAAEFSNPLEAHVGYQLRRASAAVLSRLASSLGPLKLKITEASVLVLVDDHPGITQSALGRTLGIHRANMAPLAAILTERGLIERSHASGRSQGLKTTRRGHEHAARVRHCMDAQEAAVLPALAPEQRAALIELLEQIWRAG
jgi:DNA-binding MarR family transcriptional regulator